MSVGGERGMAGHAPPNGRPWVLILGTADWNQPIATNQHYVARELARTKFSRVTFMESLALRTPQWTVRDMRRIGQRLRRVASRSRGPHAENSWRPLPEGLDVRSPIVVPVHRGVLAKANRFLLSPTVRDWAGYSGPKVLWTYTPTTYGLEELADATVYHCVDLLGAFPGIDTEAIDLAERKLARMPEVFAIASSRVVRKHLQHAGFQTVSLWENVADTEVILDSDPLGAARVPGRVIFSGNLSPKKLDYELIAALARAGLHVCVAGPRAEGGGDDAALFQSLVSVGVEYLGMLTLPELSRELVKSSVGIIPYEVNEYTRGVSPLKTYEYLSAGLAVVSTPLPGVDATVDDIWVEPTLHAFVERCRQLSRCPREEEIAQRMSTAAAHSWVGRGAQVRRKVEEALARE